MTLTVEDGSIVANADSYGTLEDYQAYAAARGWTVRDTDEEDEQDLRRAFDVINRGWTYRGVEVDADNQVGAWPRYIPNGRFEYVVPSDDIPQKIIDAQFEIAHMILGGLDPLATIKGVVKSAGAGPARVEFLGGQGKPRLVAVEGLLRPFIVSGAGQTAMMRA